MSREKCREVSVKYRTIRRMLAVTVHQDDADRRRESACPLTSCSVANPKVT